jgi:hypothetical protein
MHNKLAFDEGGDGRVKQMKYNLNDLLVSFQGDVPTLLFSLSLSFKKFPFKFQSIKGGPNIATVKTFYCAKPIKW